MNTDELKQILGVFREEAREIAEKMTSQLLQLETASSEKETASLLESLFRGAHTLKGGAGSLAIDDVVGLAHAMETLLGQCQKGQRTYQASFTDALLAGLDEICKRLDALHAGRMESGGGIAAAQARVQRVIAGERDVAGEMAADGGAREIRESFLRVGFDRIEAFSTAVDEFLIARLRMAQRAAETQRLATALESLMRRAGQRLGTDEAAELKKLSRDAGLIARELGHETQFIGAMSDDLRESLRGLQVVPASSVLDSFRRSVRDHARKVGVDVTLDIVGGEVAADRRILEGIRGALVHLLRNAVDHGIEQPAERKKLKKPPRARIAIEVAVAGSQLSFTVSDDGRGMDPKRIREVAVAKSIVTPQEAAAMDDEAALALVWRPGFSTAASVTETSGRGVGLDAVKELVLELGGRIEVTSRSGKGTTFHLRVPLMLSAAIGLSVEVAGTQYLIPLAAIEAVTRVRIASLEVVRGTPVLKHRSRAVPVVTLGGTLAGHAASPARDEERPLACVVTDGTDVVALTVDRVMGEREIAIRPLGPELQRFDYLAGATRGADGRVVLVLSPEGLVKRALEVSRHAERASDGTQRTVLVIDDAVTSRLLYRSFLESAGYRVLLASEGEEALEMLQRGGEVDAVISDVRMPRMDGFELTRRIRRLQGYENLPVLLVTSLASDEDRREGLVAGATAYLVKQDTPPEKVLDVLGGFIR